MPYLNWSPEALSDIARLEAFLRAKSPESARRAIVSIRDGVRILQQFPSAGRPMLHMPSQFRELPIGFGSSGYLVFYEYDGQHVFIRAVRRLREAGYQP